MSTNYLNHNVPGYSGNYDPRPSGDDLPGTSSDDDDSEPNTSITEETPYVSIYGMVGAKNIHQDVEMYRSTLYNLKTEPEEIRERRNQITNEDFLRRCFLPDVESAEIQYMKSLDEPVNEPVNEPQPEETTKQIKIEPVDEIEEDSFEEETEPLEYLPETYSEATENSYHVDTTHPRARDLENIRMFLEQYGQPDERDRVNLPLVNIRPEVTITAIKIEPVDETLEEETDQSEYEPESDSDMIEETRYEMIIVRRAPNNPRANELENNRMFLERYGEPEEMDGLNIGQAEQQPAEEAPSPIDTTTNPRENEPENNGMFLQQYGEPEEMDGLNIGQAEQQPAEEAPAPINTTNPRANGLDNGNTNIIENPTGVQRRKRKEVNSTPTRVSSRIKKPRIMYNV
ncbi:uncharacterized protein LOC111031330 [Myzus persicae]|uniref:uncharacterized protein LOC111031330 n=1 Tax=Myzus persicae TaxID=13164 RepID=UPI000B9389D8|nr:uncharacterized protein LOC111031330 [Myzus persicae]XP_022166915.1 uncharacterized protein LOC111031330 [Myzus persicae]